MKKTKKLIMDNIEDLVTDLTYYDRKEDSELTYDKLDECLRNGHITIDEMADHFKAKLQEVYKDILSENKSETMKKDLIKAALVTENPMAKFIKTGASGTFLHYSAETSHGTAYFMIPKEEAPENLFDDYPAVLLREWFNGSRSELMSAE